MATTTPQPNGNGALVGDGHAAEAHANGNGNGHGNGSIQTLLNDIEGLKTILRDAYTQAHKIGIGLKKHRKQAQVVQTTLTQLRQLQHVGD